MEHYHQIIPERTVDWFKRLVLSKHVIVELPPVAETMEPYSAERDLK